MERALVDGKPEPASSDATAARGFLERQPRKANRGMCLTRLIPATMEIYMDTIKIIDKTESVLESIIKDIVTFSFLIFCIWISQGNTWWTFFTATIFLMGGWTRLSVILKKKTHTFKSKAELLEWAENLEWTKN
jgi:hypothetical protein